MFSQSKSSSSERTVLGEKIHQFAKIIKDQKIDGLLASRLLSFADDLKNNPQNWLRFNVAGMFNPTQLVESARAVYRRQAVRSLLPIRVGRFLVFLFVISYSWAAIARATALYGRLAAESPVLFEESLWVLWESGFSGQLAGLLTLRFVLGILIAGALVVFIMSFWLKSRELEQLLQAEEKSAALGAEFSDLLVEIQIVLAKVRRIELEDPEQRSLAILESIDSFVQKFQSHSAELENIIAREQERLGAMAEFQKVDIRKLEDFQHAIDEFSGKLGSTGSQLSHSLNEFTGILGNLTKEMELSQHLQQKGQGIIQGTDAHLSSIKDELSQIRQVYENISSGLVTSVDQNRVKSDELVNGVESLNGLIRQISEGQINLQNLLDDQMRSNDGLVKSIQRSLTAMETALVLVKQDESDAVGAAESVKRA